MPNTSASRQGARRQPAPASKVASVPHCPLDLSPSAGPWQYQASIICNNCGWYGGRQ